MNEKKVTYEVSRSDIPLIEYSNIFLGNLVWINRGIQDDIATYDFTVREIPNEWNFLVFSGLARFVDVLLHWKYTEEDVELFKKMGLINSPESEDFYRNFKFTGDVMALKEGTVFFTGEPVLRITAPVCEANLLTAFILNAFSYPIRVLTKKVRVKIALQGKPFLDSIVVRLPGFEQSMYCLEDSYILGSAIIVPLFYKKYPNLQVPNKFNTNVNHAFIKSFETEKMAFRYALDVVAQSAGLISVMVDTYGLKAGLDNFIQEVKNTENFDSKKFMICIDSGDLFEQSFYVREVLDKNNLHEIGILVMSNLDEYKVDKMIKNKAPIDIYIVGTEIVNITDHPKLECVYKMAELRKIDGTIEQKAKLTKGKESYPGRKQIFRVFRDGKMVEDVIGLEEESLGEPMLQKVIEQGKLVSGLPSLDEIKFHLEKEITSLPDEYKDVNVSKDYKVSISDKLNNMLIEVQKKHT